MFDMLGSSFALVSNGLLAGVGLALGLWLVLYVVNGLLNQLHFPVEGRLSYHPWLAWLNDLWVSVPTFGALSVIWAFFH